MSPRLQFLMASSRSEWASTSFRSWSSTSLTLRLILAASTVLARVEGAASRAVASKPVPERGSKG